MDYWTAYKQAQAREKVRLETEIQHIEALLLESQATLRGIKEKEQHEHER